jgi:hypothetical protein
VKPALDGKISGIKAIARVVPGTGYFDFFEDYFDAGTGGRRSATLQVDPEFLKIFELPFLEGNPETALTEPDSIVLTRRLANALVGPGPALGKTVERRDTGQGVRIYRISGVIENIPPATHLRFDSMVNFEQGVRSGAACQRQLDDPPRWPLRARG